MWEVQKRIVQAQQEGFDGAVDPYWNWYIRRNGVFLELTTDGTFPIVLTGAMRSSNVKLSGRLANLRSAIIYSNESRERG